MTKLLRKYQKWLLVVLGSVLMVTFLVQGTCQQCYGDPTRVVVGSLNGRTIRSGAIMDADAEQASLERVLPGLMRGVLGVRSGTHWMLLCEEASRAGLIGDAGDGRAAIGDLGEIELDLEGGQAIRQLRQLEQAVQQNPQLADFFKEQLARDRANVEQLRVLIASRLEGGGLQGYRARTQDDYHRALAKVRGVLRLYETSSGVSRTSDSLARLELAKVVDAVPTDIVVLRAKDLAGTAPAPSEAELLAQFESHKSAHAKDSPDGMGYARPERVKIEWLKLDHAAINAAIPVDPVEARKRHLQDKARYPGEFEANRAAIESELRQAALDKVYAEIDRSLGASLRVLRQAADDGPYKKLPADWDRVRPKLEDVAALLVESVKGATGVTIPTPTVEVRAASWLTREDLAALPGIGGASARIATARVTLPDLALSVRELRTKETTAPEVGLQARVPLLRVPVTDGQNNRYYITVLEARGPSPADDLGEVRADVERDCRALATLARLKGEMESLKSLAVAEGLDAVAKQAVPAGDTTTRAPLVQRRASIRRTPGQFADEVMKNEKLIEAVFAAAAPMDPTKAAGPETLASRTLVLDLAREQCVVVAQVVGVQPLTAEDVRRVGRFELSQLIRQARGTEAMESPFSLKAVAARLGYVPSKESALGADAAVPEAPEGEPTP